MRIFFITSKLNFITAGGSVEELDLMARTLQKWGNDVTFVTAFSQWNDIPKQPPYRIIEEHITATGLVGIQLGIYRLLKKYSGQADVFQLDGHLFLYGAGAYRRLGGTVPVSAFFNRELISWPENQSPFFPQPKVRVLRRVKKKLRCGIEKYIGMRLANGIDWWSTISPQFRQQYEEFGLKKDPTTKIIGDPIDLLHIRAEQGIEEATYPARNKRTGPYTIFYSGRMAPAKGFDVLLTAFSKVKNKEDFRLRLGGNGPEEKYVRQMIKDLRLEPYVELLGWTPKDRLYQLHKEADMFVQADWMWFGTSVSLLYSLAFCLPCIIPRDTGMHWVAKDAALTFSYRDPDDLARKIEQLGADYDLRERLSRAAWRRLEADDLDYEKQIGLLHEGLKQLAHRASR